MKQKIAKQLRQRQRKIRQRLGQRSMPEEAEPMLNPGHIHYEISDRHQGMLYGGIGAERCKQTYAFKSFLDHGVVLAFGSDWDVAPLNVIWGIYAAVTRRTVDGADPAGWIPEQKITVEQAIEAYTLAPAYASFQDDIKGTITVGKLADMVVLSDDILTIDPVEIENTEVACTIVDGKVVYKKK